MHIIDTSLTSETRDDAEASVFGLTLMAIVRESVKPERDHQKTLGNIYER